jgi:uncharacterized protein YndB with AHSA1/START domain
MENMKFSVAINAPMEKVFENMLGQEGYPQWRSVFNPFSSFEGPGHRMKRFPLLAPINQVTYLM